MLLSLVLGKTLGICLTSQVATCLGCPPPAGMTKVSVAMVGFIASAGLTVALFVSGEAFSDAPELATQSKMGALMSAAVAFVAIGGSLVQGRKTNNAGGEELELDIDQVAPDSPTKSHTKPSLDLPLEAMVVSHAVRSLNLAHDATDAIERRAGMARSKTIELIKASMTHVNEEDFGEAENLEHNVRISMR